MMIRIRIVGTPNFVGKSNPSYAFVCDRQRAERKDDYYPSGSYMYGYQCLAAWLVPEPRAKVWTEPTSLCRLLSMSAWGANEQFESHKWHQTTWSAYEVVLPDGTALPLDTWLTNQGLRP